MEAGSFQRHILGIGGMARACRRRLGYTRPVMVVFPGSGRQGREAWRVRVHPSSRTVFLTDSFSEKKPEIDMEYVRLGTPNNSECRRFSRLVMGTDHLAQACWTSSSQPAPHDDHVHAVLDEAARHGINLFDTAPIYVDDVEKKLGEWRTSRQTEVEKDDFYVDPSLNPDRKLYALSKGGFPFDLWVRKNLPAGCHSGELINELKRRRILSATADAWKTVTYPVPGAPPGTYASHLYCDPKIMVDRISQELEKSRKNLGCHIELYLMHRDDGDAVSFEEIQRRKTPVEDILKAVSSPDIAKYFSMLGWSNWQPERVNASLDWVSQRSDLARPMINSPYFSLFEMSGRPIHALGVQATHAEMMDANFMSGIKIMPYSPLGGFSILDQPAPQWENAKSAAFEKCSSKDPVWMNVYSSIFTKANEARWGRAVQFAEDFNRKHSATYTVDQILNAYVLAHPRTDLLAIGAITVDQVRRTVGALDLSKMLSFSDLEHLYSGEVAPSLGKG